ncbi:MAG: cobalamin-dependent protein, partial [Nanoarchaeota archaeon]
MADVLFIYPRQGINVKHVSVWLPLSILSAAGPLLQKGYTVKILDARLDDNWENTLKEEVKKKPIFVGLSAMAGPQLHWALRTAEIVKENNPDIPLVWGGVLVNLIQNVAIKDPRVDIIVIGDAEETLVELCSKLRNRESLEGVLGITYKTKDSKPVFNPPRKFVDLNTLPPIPYHLVNIEDYFATIAQGEKGLIAVTSRGCPWRCAFCYNTAFNKEGEIRKWRAYNAERVVENLKQLKEFGANAIYVTEDDFVIDMKRVVDVCNLLIKENLNLILKTSVRADEALRIGKERLMLMKKAGFSEFQIGSETNSDRLLKLMKKDLKVEQIVA